MALAIVGGISVQGDAVVPAMNVQPLSLVPSFHPSTPGPTGHTNWWTIGPDHHLQPGSFNRIDNSVYPCDFRPPAEELTTVLSEYWPIARHPELALAWAVVYKHADPATTEARVQRWNDSCCIDTPLTLPDEPTAEHLFPGYVVPVYRPRNPRITPPPTLRGRSPPPTSVATGSRDPHPFAARTASTNSSSSPQRHPSR